MDEGCIGIFWIAIQKCEKNGGRNNIEAMLTNIISYQVVPSSGFIKKANHFTVQKITVEYVKTLPI